VSMSVVSANEKRVKKNGNSIYAHQHGLEGGTLPSGLTCAIGNIRWEAKQNITPYFRPVLVTVARIVEQPLERVQVVDACIVPAFVGRCEKPHIIDQDDAEHEFERQQEGEQLCLGEEKASRVIPFAEYVPIEDSDEEESVNINEDETPEFPEEGTARFVAVMRYHQNLKLEQCVPTCVCSGRRKNGRKPGKKKRQGEYSAVVPKKQKMRFMGDLFPAELETVLRQEYIFTLSGASTVAKLFNPNCAFQPDIGTGGTVPTYTTLASQYSFYRVMGYRYSFKAVNLGTVAALVYDINSTNTPTSTPPATRIANPLCGVKTVSLAGGMDRATLSRNLRIAEVVGDKACDTADSFRGAVTGSPADLTWLAICAQSLSGATLATGIAFEGQITFYVRWTGRILQ